MATRVQNSGIIPLFFTVYASAIRLAVQIEPFALLDPGFPILPEIVVIKGDPRFFPDGFSHGSDNVVLLKFAVKQRRAETVELAMLRHQRRGFQTVVVTVTAAIGFPENDVPQKPFKVIGVLVNYLKIDAGAVILEGLFPFKAFRVWMDVVPIEKSHHRQSGFPQVPDGHNAAGCTADMKKYLHDRFPKIAVPMRTRVAPSAMAASKSPDMPMESSIMSTFGSFWLATYPESSLKALK